ncbi:MAG TPA: pilus assembly protein TadB, partial [Marivita sp.]|nr:pilus assembly protein TadB [Marivita sp.]
KWSGKFLSGFPIAALIGINLLDPNYYDNVLDHPWFVPACFAVGGFLVANLLVMRRLVDIKV